jgi:acetyl-CoA synthetase
MSLSIEYLKQLGVDKNLIEKFNFFIQSNLTPESLWKGLCQEILPRIKNFEIHQAIHSRIFEHWETQKKGPSPWWIKDEKQIHETNLFNSLQKANCNSYEDFHRFSVESFEDFWEQTIQTLGIKFQKPYSKIVTRPTNYEAPDWLPQAKINIVESCFQGDPEGPAIIFQKEGGKPHTISQKELENLSKQVANSIIKQGFTKGDCLAVAMPMTVESVGIYLGILYTGCVAVSIADSFSAKEIETRLRISKAKAIFTVDHMARAGKKIPLYQRVLEAKAEKIIVLPLDEDQLNKIRPQDIYWKDFLSSKTTFETVSCNPKDYINILFSSGTTGDPKAIPWNHLTPIKAAMDGHYHQDIRPKDIVCWPTNLGWMMGPWLIFATLINKGVIALYYGVPTGEEFGDFVETAKVNVLGLVPSIVKSWRQTQCMEKKDWNAIKCFSSTGECSNSDDYSYLMYLANYKPIIEYCGGTEIGGGYLTGTLLQNASPATFTTPTLGLDIRILDEEQKETSQGEVFIVPPSFGLSEVLLNRDHHEVYFKGTKILENSRPLRNHGDQIEKIEGPYYRAHGRADDTMNLGGIKVSSAEIERTINSLPTIYESAAIAVSPQRGGPSYLVIFVILKTQEEKEKLLKVLATKLKKDLNPLFKVEDVVIVDSLPRTSSNKVMRRVLRKNYQERGHK